MKRISADFLVDADHYAWRLAPAGSRRKIYFRVVPIRDNTVLNGILQFDCTSRFRGGSPAHASTNIPRH